MLKGMHSSNPLLAIDPKLWLLFFSVSTKITKQNERNSTTVQAGVRTWNRKSRGGVQKHRLEHHSGSSGFQYRFEVRCQIYAVLRLNYSLERKHTNVVEIPVTEFMLWSMIQRTQNFGFSIYTIWCWSYSCLPLPWWFYTLVLCRVCNNTSFHKTYFLLMVFYLYCTFASSVFVSPGGG